MPASTPIRTNPAFTQKSIPRNHKEYKLHNMPRPSNEYESPNAPSNTGRPRTWSTSAETPSKNRVILRIHFSRPVHRGRSYAPRGTKGFLLEVRPHGPEEKYGLGDCHVYVKTIGIRGIVWMFCIVLIWRGDELAHWKILYVGWEEENAAVSFIFDGKGL